MKRQDSYSVLIVPSDHKKIRRILVLGWQIRLGVLLVLILGGLGILSATGFFYYRSLYWSTENQRIEAAKFDQQKMELLAKIGNLEGTIERTSRFAQKLETVVDSLPSKVDRGLGPIERSSWDFLKKEDGEIPEEYKYLLTGRYLNANLAEKIKFLEESVAKIESGVDATYELYQDKMVTLASTPSIWPTNGWVTSNFGYRRNPITSMKQLHRGYDIAAQWGSPVLAAADGVVTYAGYLGKLGKVVKIDHGFGMKTIYGHNSNLFVKTGEKVKRGEKIASVGNSGWTTGTHLHYEVLVAGIPVNPSKFILE